jgi:polyribonucleotide nucleotidyltransferase
MIRSITEQSGATVDIDDDGTVRVFGQDQAARDKAVGLIEEITAEAEVGAVYKAASSASWTSVPSSTSSRARTACCTFRRSPTSASRMSRSLSEGDRSVKVLDVDQRGRIKLSIKELLEDEAAGEQDSAGEAEATG